MEAGLSFLEQIHRELVLLHEQPILEKESIELFFGRMCDLCTRDENCAVVATRVFTSLSQNAKDPFKQHLFRRTAQEIRAAAVHIMSEEADTSMATAVQFMQRLAITVECVAANEALDPKVRDAIVSILSNDDSSGHQGAALVLSRAFENLLIEPTQYDDVQIVDSGDAPTNSTLMEGEVRTREALLGTLGHPEVFNSLIQLLFTKKGRPPDGYGKFAGVKRRRCLCMLLGHAAVFHGLTPDVVRAQLRNANGLGLLRGRVLALRQRVEQCAIVCEELKPGCPRFLFKAKPVRTLLGGLDSHVISVGVLEWAREGLWGADDQRSLLVTAPKHLAFLDAIAEKHESMRTIVVEIVHLGFVRNYNLDVHDKEKLLDIFMDSMISMLRHYKGPAIVENFLHHYADDTGLDEAHLRRFVRCSLQLIVPPYEREFATIMRDLVLHPRVSQSVSGDKTTMGLVNSFLEEVRRVR